MTSTRSHTSWNTSRTVRTRGRATLVCARAPHKTDWSRHRARSIALASVSTPYLMRDLSAMHHTDITPYHTPLSVQGEGLNTHIPTARSPIICLWRRTVSSALRMRVYINRRPSVFWLYPKSILYYRISILLIIRV